LQQQIFRRISRKRELWKRDDVRVGITSALHPVNNFLRVSFDVADDDIYLSYRQTQLRRVLHESAALKTNATAIVTERRSLRPEVAPLLQVRSAETHAASGFNGYLQRP